MRENNPKNVNKTSGQLMSKLGGDKKKAISAICLVAVMIFMWIRVLGGKGPQDAQGEAMDSKSEAAAVDKTAKVTFVELPIVKGRNDMLVRDFFTVGGKDVGNYGKVSVVSSDANEDSLAGVKNKIKLEAISMGQKPQAFINSKLLSQGEKLKVEEGVNSYEFEVMKIENNRVILKSKDMEIVLSLSQAVEVVN